MIGYVGRVLSATENPGPYSLGAYILQSVLLLIAPALFAASLYMELGRIVLMVRGDTYLFIRRTLLTKLFVCGDIISFFVQAGGAGILSGGSAHVTIGKIIIVVGLIFQVIFFGLFVSAALIFHRRMSKRPTALAQTRPWKKHMLSLYIVSALILIRSVVRIVEFAQGYQGYVITHEVFLYLFDALFMFGAVVTMLVIHPGEVAEYIREDRGAFGGEKGNQYRGGEPAV